MFFIILNEFYHVDYSIKAYPGYIYNPEKVEQTSILGDPTIFSTHFVHCSSNFFQAGIFMMSTNKFRKVL